MREMLWVKPFAVVCNGYNQLSFLPVYADTNDGGFRVAHGVANGLVHHLTDSLKSHGRESWRHIRHVQLNFDGIKCCEFIDDFLE
jgi:hypothetical protein